jgi:hypothetical protein
MAVAFKLRFTGATIEQYDEVIELMGFTGGTADADGAIFHWVAKTDDGLLVVDVWESDEQFERFSEEQIVPYTHRPGSPSRRRSRATRSTTSSSAQA